MHKHTSIEDILVAVNKYVLDQREQKESVPLRLSASGTCARRLAYDLFYPQEAEPLSSRAMHVFELGHVIHDLERAKIREVALLHREEERVYFQVDGIPETLPEPLQPQVKDGILHVPGHVDGVLELADGPALIDIKTTSTRSFEDKVSNGAGYEYTAQLNAYMYATGIHRAWLWLYNKDTSHKAVIPVPYEPRIVEEIKVRFRKVAHATPDNLPEREHSPKQEMRKKVPTGREYLPYQCTYCPYTKLCWEPEGFAMHIENGKPRWLRESQEDL